MNFGLSKPQIHHAQIPLLFCSRFLVFQKTKFFQKTTHYTLCLSANKPIIAKKVLPLATDCRHVFHKNKCRQGRHHIGV